MVQDIVDSLGVSPDDSTTNVVYSVNATIETTIETGTTPEEAEECIINYLYGQFPCIHPSAISVSFQVDENGETVFSLEIKYGDANLLSNLESLLEGLECPGMEVNSISVSTIAVHIDI